LPVVHTSVLIDDGCDYQEKRCQSRQKDVRAKLAFAIPGREEKKAEPEGGEGQSKKGKEPITRMAVEIQKMKRGNTTQDDDGSADEIVHD
jgi:hypothetical protein